MEQAWRFILNDAETRSELPAATVVLDFLRAHRRMTGTKEACREGDCGACMVLLGSLNGDAVHYRALNSCLLPLAEVNGKHLVSIEGLNRLRSGEPELTPIQQRLVDQGAIQCGFCTPGFVVSITSFFLNSKDLRLEEALNAVAGNVCRCTGYTSIKRVLGQLIDEYAGRIAGFPGRVKSLVELNILPEYFLGIASRLQKIRGEALPAGRFRPSQASRPGFLVAGGTDLFVQMPERLIENDIDLISNRPELCGIRIENGRCIIGAGTPMEDLKQSPQMQKLFPDFPKYMELVASAPIRQRATVGGNIANASPIGDMTIFLLALDSTLSLSSGKGFREVHLKDFFKGYKKLDLREGEILEAVSFPLPDRKSLFHFEKVSRRRHLDIASVNSAAYILASNGRINSARLSAGGVAPVPFYLGRTSELLAGKEISAATVQEAARSADGEVAPISDVRGTAEYKRLLLRQLLFAHFMALFPEQITAEELL